MRGMPGQAFVRGRPRCLDACTVQGCARRDLRFQRLHDVLGEGGIPLTGSTCRNTGAGEWDGVMFTDAAATWNRGIAGARRSAEPTPFEQWIIVR